MAVTLKICEGNRTRNILVIVFVAVLATLLAASKYFSTTRLQNGRREHLVFDSEHRVIIGGMEPMIRQPPKVFDDGNADIPFRFDIISDLFGFRCKCHLGYHPQAILIIYSNHSSQDRRDAIRSTWGSPQICRRNQVVLRFVMGRPDSEEQARLLIKEMEQYKDMMIGNFTSQVISQVLQAFLAIRWIRQFCPPTPYLIQASDKTFMMLDKLENVMSTFLEGENSNSVIGYRLTSLQVYESFNGTFRFHSSAFGRSSFPPFCVLAAGFVMPFSMALQDFTNFDMESRFMPYLDVHYGFSAEKYNWTIQHNDAFADIRLKGTQDACIIRSKFTAIGLLDIDKIYDIWRNITDPESEKDCKNRIMIDNDAKGR